MLVSRLLGCYPSLGIHDPETYIAGVTALLCGFSLWVGERAIDRVTKTTKFVPTIAEINEACEHFAPSKRMSYADEWNARTKLQLAERAAIEQEIPSDERERVKAKFAALLAYLRSNTEAGKKDAEFTPERVKAKFGISDATWDAIPDQPTDQGYWRGVRMPKNTDPVT